MANELQVKGSMRCTLGGGLNATLLGNVSLATGTVTADLAGSEGIEQSVGTGAAITVDMGGFTATTGHGTRTMVQNISAPNATNKVLLGYDSSVAAPLMQLDPGEIMQLHLPTTTPAKVLYAIASGATQTIRTVVVPE